jgi:hypothetical protein
MVKNAFHCTVVNLKYHREKKGQEPIKTKKQHETTTHHRKPAQEPLKSPHHHPNHHDAYTHQPTNQPNNPY